MKSCCGEECGTSFCPHCGGQVNGNPRGLLLSYLAKQYSRAEKARETEKDKMDGKSPLRGSKKRLDNASKEACDLADMVAYVKSIKPSQCQS